MDIDDSQLVTLPVEETLPTRLEIWSEIALKKKEHGKRCTSPVLNGILKDVTVWLLDKWQKLGIPTMKFDNVKRALSRITAKDNDDVLNIAKCKHALQAKPNEPFSKYDILSKIFRFITLKLGRTKFESNEIILDKFSCRL